MSAKDVDALYHVLTRLDHAKISAYHSRLRVFLGEFDCPNSCPSGDVEHIPRAPNRSTVECTLQVYREGLVLKVQPILLSLFGRPSSAAHQSSLPVACVSHIPDRWAKSTSPSRD